MKLSRQFLSFLFAFVILCYPVFGQLNDLAVNETAIQINDTTGTDRVVHPMADPYVFYEPYDSGNEFQTGMFAGISEFGVQVSLINHQYNFFGTLFLADSFKPENRIPGAGSMYTGGITLGKQFLLNASTTSYDRTIYYARVGPGIGVAGVNSNLSQGLNTYYGMHATVLAGVQKPFSGLGSLYIELGARTAWFPAMEEKSLLGGPHMSVGFLFSGSRNIVPVRF